MHRAIEARVGSPRNFLSYSLTFFKSFPFQSPSLSPTLPLYSPLPDSPRSHCDRRPHLSPSTSRHGTPRTVRNMRHTVRTAPHRTASTGPEHSCVLNGKHASAQGSCLSLHQATLRLACAQCLSVARTGRRLCARYWRKAADRGAFC